MHTPRLPSAVPNAFAAGCIRRRPRGYPHSMSETNASNVKAAAEQAASTGKAAAAPAGRALITVGLITYGVVHLLIAWIALQLAWGGGGGQASQQGAMAELAGNPVGLVVLWATAIGMVALVVWQVSEAINGLPRRIRQGQTAAPTPGIGRAGGGVRRPGLDRVPICDRQWEDFLGLR